ncbi:uncharacterized protein LOC108098220 [Drosophila ficusphila]|uniref:uncharacterized protein LOC108098220 n=1 Tax=Drosophila ficusphila TaxID=30025 RepID=UPI001C89E75C|nr:uncharacterized protein LOC108098220 [Drosophila ficusphila]
MLERSRRSQLSLDSLYPAPVSSTTMRRTRRVCLNIEANGSGPLRPRRRRRRELLNPYFVTYPPIYDPMQLGHPWNFNVCSNSLPCTGYETLADLPYRLNAGDQYECDSLGEISLPEESNNSNCQQAVHDLKDILKGLDGYLQSEKVNLTAKEQVEPVSIQNQDDQNSDSKNCKLSVLTDIMCVTIDRLNNYIANNSKQQQLLSTLSQGNLLRGSVPPVQVVQLPVQPLILQPMASYPSSNHYPPPEPSVQKKSLPERLPWLKERKRKRPPKPPAYIHLQNQESSTEDLNVLPKTLEASNSTNESNKFSVPQQSPSQSTRDSGTTMWCSMKCNKAAYSLGPKDELFPPCLKAPPPSIKSEDEIEGQEQYFHTPPESIFHLGSPQTCSYTSSCDFFHEGGNLRYSYIEEEEEEEQVDKDDWYRSTSNKLAELEVEQDYFNRMEKQTRFTTKDETLQTDIETSSENSFLTIIATTDKAISTTGLNRREPIKIERICKKSSLKQRPRHKNGNQKEDLPGTPKVTFKKLQSTEGVQVRPETKSLGTDPIKKESILNIRFNPSTETLTDQKVKLRSRSNPKRSVGFKESPSSLKSKSTRTSLRSGKTRT